jgi:hypothetical protein
VRTVLDAAMILALLLAAGSAGWWARATVDDWKMRRLLVRIHAQVDEATRR